MHLSLQLANRRAVCFLFVAEARVRIEHQSQLLFNRSNPRRVRLDERLLCLGAKSLELFFEASNRLVDLRVRARPVFGKSLLYRSFDAFYSCFDLSVDFVTSASDRGLHFSYDGLFELLQQLVQLGVLLQFLFMDAVFNELAYVVVQHLHPAIHQLEFVVDVLDCQLRVLFNGVQI